MNSFQPGDKVLIDHPKHPFVGTVNEPVTVGLDSGWMVTSTSGGIHFVNTWPMTVLPADAPLFRFGQPVVLVDDGRLGSAAMPEFHGSLFGYWVRFDDTGGLIWIPAEILAPVEAGDRR